ncbi:MAG: glycosyltransferase family 2 protein [Marinicaulis sp.]|nr:glycosyltransferase family 2 protein [Marinicaulis sp.]
MTAETKDTDTPHLCTQEPCLSVVSPMYNEAGGAAALVREIDTALDSINHEIIIVNDGSDDDTVKMLEGLRSQIPSLRIISHEKNAGQSRALRTGVIAARAPIIAMLDGDGQNNPIDIVALYEKLNAGSCDSIGLVAGERTERQDSKAKKIASSAANGIRKRLLNDDANDTGCGLKVFSRDAFLKLPYFDHMHRYLPALMRREGYGVTFLPVSHRPRLHGQSKYNNLGRLLVAIRDLLGVIWLLARSRSPGRITESGE